MIIRLKMDTDRGIKENPLNNSKKMKSAKSAKSAKNAKRTSSFSPTTYDKGYPPGHSRRCKRARSTNQATNDENTY